MSTSKNSLFEAVLARISLGAVPMDGIYWFDPKAAAKAAATDPGALSTRRSSKRASVRDDAGECEGKSS